MDAPQTLSWSSDEIARFWDYWSSRNDSQETYFALQVGAGVARFAEQVNRLSGKHVLDFGSGPGHLVSHLLDRGAQVSAADHSPNSVDEVRRKFEAHPNWREARLFENGRLPWRDASFDVAFCLETIEHLHREDCARIFDELLRVLRPGGFVVFTTPNEEELDKQHVYCPSCNCHFHRWQHLRSWSHTQLNNELTAHGYEVPFCGGLDFHNFQPSPSSRVRLSTIKRTLRTRAFEMLDRIFPKPFPHGRLFQFRVKRSDRHHLAAVAVKPAVQQVHQARAA